MTFGGVGFGNWIPAVLYARSGVSIAQGAQDAKRIVIRREKPDHPSPKPIEFMQWIVGLFTEPGDLVVDPFAGSGSTGVACINLGRDFLGFEIDEGYCELARRRLAGAQPPLVLT